MSARSPVATPSPAPPPSAGSVPRNSPRTRAAANCAWRPRRCATALDDAGIAAAEVDGLVTFAADTNPEIEVARTLGMGDLTFFSRIHYGGGAACATVHQAAMAVASGVADVVVCYRAFNERSGHRFGTGVQGRAPIANAENAHFSWYAPAGAAHPGVVGGHVRPALPARHRRHHRGLRTGGGGRPRLRGHQPQGVVLREAHHLGGPPGVALDRRAAAPARLLPGVRRRPGHRGHEPRAGPRRRQAAGGDRGRGPGLGRPAGHDDVVLPRRHDASARDGRGGAPAVGDLGARPRRHAVRRALRPLHPVRALPARGARLLRVGRGQGVPARRPHRAGRQAAHQHPRRPAGRGLHPRHERHRRGRAPGAGHAPSTRSRGPSTCVVTAGTGVPTSGLVLGVDR